MKKILTFRQWYMGLTPEEKPRYRERITEATGLSMDTIYGFVQENRTVRKLAREKIIEIIGFEVEFRSERKKPSKTKKKRTA